MAGVTETYPVTLTKVSDADVKIECNVAANKQGAPRMELGAVSQERATPSQSGGIRIESLRGGSGQRVARDPTKYLSNRGSAVTEIGWETWHDGYLVGTGGWQADTTVSSDAGYISKAKAAHSGKIFATPDESHVLITAGAIFEDSAAPALKDTPPDGANSRFTGSVVTFGNRSFFGAEHDGTREGEQVAVRSNSGTYTDGAFDANQLKVIGARMFRLRYDATNEIWYLSWTTETGTDTPTFSTEYPLPSQGRNVGKLESVSGQALICLSSTGNDLDAVFYAMDLEGTITPLTAAEGMGVTGVVASGNYMGKPAFLLTGRTPAIAWFRDLLDVSILNLNFVAVDESVPTLDNDLGGLSSNGPLCWTVFGDALLVGLIDEDGWHVHEVDSNWWSITHSPIALRAGSFDSGGEPIRLDVLWVDNVAGEIKLTDYNLHGGITLTASNSSGQTHTLTTSIYDGDIWVSKKFTRVRGYVRLKSAGTGALTITAYVDGVAKGSGGIAADGAFSITLDADAVGRGVHLTLVTTDDYTCAVELPLDIDFFYVPDQKDVISIPVVIGRDQITQGGTLDKKGRQDSYDLLTAAIDAPEGWTLHFGDGRTDWTVIPVGLEARPLGPEYTPGSDTAVVWLSLQRV